MAKKVYGTCPNCGYMLTLENSHYVADFQDIELNEKAIKKNLLKYHKEVGC